MVGKFAGDIAIKFCKPLVEWGFRCIEREINVKGAVDGGHERKVTKNTFVKHVKMKNCVESPT